jgi:hypothetical protein
MTKLLDITGIRFGSLTAIERAENKNGVVYWNCLCDCGNTKKVTTSHLRQGNVTSCGCKWHTNLIEDLCGKEFGFLKVLEKAKNKHGRVHWRCLCKCGNIKDIMASHLKRGAVTSCGCNRFGIGEESNSWKGYGQVSGRYWTRIKRGADERKLEFSISIEQVWMLFEAQDKKCALTGLDIILDKEQTASLDRIDSSKGYTIDNVQWVHKDINKMKMDLGQEIFFKYCKLIVENKKL